MIRKIFIKTIDFTINNLEKTKSKVEKIDKQKLKKNFKRLAKELKNTTPKQLWNEMLNAMMFEEKQKTTKSKK
jgi:uncharacterized protein with gpF-like domain